MTRRKSGILIFMALAMVSILLIYILPENVVLGMAIGILAALCLFVGFVSLIIFLAKFNLDNRL